MNLTDPSDTGMSKCELRRPNATSSSIEIRHSTFPAASAFRFVDELPVQELATLWSRLQSDDLPVEVNRQQREMVLREKPAPYVTKTKKAGKKTLNPCS